MAGLTSAGFTKKTLADIKAEIEASLKAKFGPGINLQPPSVWSQLVGIFSERESAVWDVAQDTHLSQYPDTASGINLDYAVDLTGEVRLPATKSVITQQLFFGDPGTIIPIATVISVQGAPLSKFQTDAAVVLIAGTDEVQKISFASVPTGGAWSINFNSRVTSGLAYNANAAAVQTALNALSNGAGITVSGDYTVGFTVTFAGAAGKRDQVALVITGNTLVNGITPIVPSITTLTPGVPQGSVSMTAQTAGATAAPAESLTEIDNPIAGLDSTLNPLDANVGRNLETDLALRLRRRTTLQVSGAATPDAIRSKVLALAGVTDAIVFENDTMLDDIDGRPPKSFEVVVAGGTAQTITQTIWETKPAGVKPVGNQTGTAIDSMGLGKVVRWSRPTEVPIYLIVNAITDMNYPVDGDQQIKDAIATYGATFRIGQDVIVSPKLICVLDNIPGITNLTILAGIAPSPTLSATIVIAPQELATFDESNMTVNS